MFHPFVEWYGLGWFSRSPFCFRLFEASYRVPSGRFRGNNVECNLLGAVGIRSPAISLLRLFYSFICSVAERWLSGRHERDDGIDIETRRGSSTGE